MDTWLIISILILVVVLMLLGAFLIVNRKKKQTPDYYTLFIMGLLWAAIGPALENYFLSVMGVIFMVLGLVHKKEWKKHKNWDDLSKRERGIKLAIMIILLMLVIAGLIVYILLQ